MQVVLTVDSQILGENLGKWILCEGIKLVEKQDGTLELWISTDVGQAIAEDKRVEEISNFLNVLAGQGDADNQKGEQPRAT